MKVQTKGRNLWFLILLCSVFFVFQSPAAEAQTTGSIKGTVKDSSENLVQGLYVDVYDANNSDPWTGWKASAQTDSNGSYEVTGLSACTDCYKVNFYTYGTAYATEWYNDQPDFASATKLSVVAGVATSCDAVLSVGGSISGRVTNSDGGAIADVYVYLYKNTYENGSWTKTWVTTDMTDGNGNYKAEGLPTGYNYTIYFGAFETDYISKWYGVSILVNDTTEKTGINIQLDKGGKISGKVTYYSGTGEQLPVVNGWVDVYDSIADNSGEPVWRGYGRTGADGAYTVTGLPAGNFKVQFFEKYSGGVTSGLTEWYDNKSDFNAATAVTIAGAAETANINAVLGYNKKAVSASLIPVYKLLLLKPRQ
jgi:hypothetical protein